MRNKLSLSAVLALLAVGCKTAEPRPEPPPGGSPPVEAAPKLPPTQYIPDTGGISTVPRSTHIVVGLCPATHGYTVVGVDTRSRQFTFLMKGSRASQPQVFNQLYAARAPVTVYTGPVRLVAPLPAPAPTPAPAPAPAPAPGTEPGTEPSLDDPTFDPCSPIGDPVPDPERQPTGSKADEQNQLFVFRELAWRTAHSLDAVSDEATPSTTPTSE
jgi:hypothetical protein